MFKPLVAIIASFGSIRQTILQNRIHTYIANRKSTIQGRQRNKNAQRNVQLFYNPTLKRGASKPTSFDLAPLAPLRGEGLGVRGFALCFDRKFNALLSLKSMNKSLNRRPASQRATLAYASGYEKQSILPLLCLLIVSASVFMVQLGNTHLWDQDEGFYATTAAEMHARSDWIKPTFNGQLFAHKPPMMFWGMMLGYEVFGVSELGARFASTLFGLGTVFLTFAVARRLFDVATGLFAGLAIGSCITFTMVSRSATADAHLTFFTALALHLWVRDYFAQPESSRESRLAGMRWQTWAATYAAMGLAVLTKGPIGFLFPTAVIGLFLLTEQSHVAVRESSWAQRVWAAIKPYTPIAFFATIWRMRPLTAVAAVLLVASPWYLLVQWRTNGAFLNEFIGVHHLGRMSQAMDNHSGPIYYYLIACLIGLYPWSAFAIPTVLSWFRQAKDLDRSRAVRFVSCWVAVYLVIFSMASTKLPNYVLPAYPAMAIVIGRYFAMWTQDIHSVNRFWLKAGWCLLIVFGVAIATGIPLSGFVEFGGKTMLDRVGMDRVLQQRFVWLGIAGTPLVIFGTVGVCLLWSNRLKLSAGAFSVAAVSMIIILAQYVAPELDRLQSPQLLAERWSEKLARDQGQVAVLGFFRPTMVFYFGQDVDFCKSPEDAIAFARDKEHSILVTTEKHYAEIKDRLPESTQVIERVAQFPNRGEVVVLGDKSLIR